MRDWTTGHVDWNNIDQNTILYITDGDDNTPLSESQVEQYVTNDVINTSGSQVGGSDRHHLHRLHTLGVVLWVG